MLFQLSKWLVNSSTSSMLTENCIIYLCQKPTFSGMWWSMCGEFCTVMKPLYFHPLAEVTAFPDLPVCCFCNAAVVFFIQELRALFGWLLLDMVVKAIYFKLLEPLMKNNFFYFWLPSEFGFWPSFVTTTPGSPPAMTWGYVLWYKWSTQQ